MVLINGNNFEVYDLDTKESVMERIATMFQTTPKYLYFPDGVPTIEELRDSSKDITVENLLTVIMRHSRNSDSMKKLYGDIKDKIGQQKVNILLDVIEPYIIYYGGFQGLNDDFIKLILMDLQGDINGLKLIEIDTNKIWEDKARIRHNLENLITINKRISEEQIVLFRQFQQINPDVRYTDFELQQVTYQNILNIYDISILEIFNYIKLNVSSPFATISDFYKILKDFIPPQDWAYSLEEGIILKISQKINAANSKPIDYTSTYIVIEDNDEPEKRKIYTQQTIKIVSGYLSLEEFNNRFLNVFSGSGLSIKSVVEEKVKGVFYFPDFSFNKYVLADLIMNDVLFSSLLSIDESQNASKKRSGIYIHLKHPDIGSISANIIENVMRQNDAYVKGSKMKFFTMGQRYVRVKISSALNREIVLKFQNLLSRVFVAYVQKSDNLINIYRRYIPNFGEAEPIQPIVVKKKTLRDIAPEIFTSGYTRRCGVLRNPSIVDNDEMKEEISRGNQVMVFPKNNEKSDSRNYVCNTNPGYRYPGVQKNNLKSKEDFPYVPCCFQSDQQNSSNWKHYFLGQEKGEVVQQNIYSTSAIIPKNTFGVLPSNIVKLFGVVDNDTKYRYLRKGVNRDKNSFLRCVLEATNNGMLNVDDVRRDLATEAKVASCKQEMYDYTVDEIIEKILDPDVYLDPKLFIHLLETEFKCNILLFTRNNMNGEMTLPRYKQVYYRTQSSKNFVLIFEHLGSERDAAGYPQCELICRCNNVVETDIVYSFPSDVEYIEKLMDVYSDLRKSYVLDKEIPETVFPVDLRSVISQKIDTYGKTRQLNFEFGDQEITLLTSPIQPTNIIEHMGNRIIKVYIQTALDFAAANRIIITRQIVGIDGKVKEICGRVGNVLVSIPVVDSDVINGIPDSEENVDYLPNNGSVISAYNYYKKLCRYITEYMFWLYSNFLYENNSVDMTFSSMVDFRKRYIEIIPTFEYGVVSKTFSRESGIMSNNKLIIKSDETLKRLFYVLRIYSIRNYKKLLNYYSKTFIEQYYIDIADFDNYFFQVILQGSESVLNWVEEKKIKYNMHDKPMPNMMSLPYFFHNDSLNSGVYLAQNIKSYSQGIEIAKVWKDRGFNPGDELMVENEDLLSFELYHYQNEKLITRYKVRGAENDYNIKILVHKFNDTEELFYTVLLSLN